MSDKVQLRILQPADKDAVLELGRRGLALQVADKMEQEMQSWSARWRLEALEYYLKLGWSFGAFDGENLVGFSLAQPLLFFRGLTQTVWIEHLEGSADARELLLDCTYRWARDKHFQCVLREGEDGAWIELKSSRFQ